MADKITEWQPIETAPKDGVSIWVYIPGTGFKKGRSRRYYPARQMMSSWVASDVVERRLRDRRHIPSDQAIELASRFGGYWGIGAGHKPISGSPTHWMPLPAAPDEADEADEPVMVPIDVVRNLAELAYSEGTRLPPMHLGSFGATKAKAAIDELEAKK